MLIVAYRNLRTFLTTSQPSRNHPSPRSCSTNFGFTSALHPKQHTCHFVGGTKSERHTLNFIIWHSIICPFLVCIHLTSVCPLVANSIPINQLLQQTLNVSSAAVTSFFLIPKATSQRNPLMLSSALVHGASLDWSRIWMWRLSQSLTK